LPGFGGFAVSFAVTSCDEIAYGSFIIVACGRGRNPIAGALNIP
jgi:hypothetical protein